MKGIELPVNALIIISIALLVLLGIVALWMSGWGTGAQGVTVEAAKAAGCGALLRDSRGCAAVLPSGIYFDGNNATVPKFDVNKDGKICPAGPDGIEGTTDDCAPADSLQFLCSTYYGTGATASACRQVCGCTG
jgi:hypothetical protein